MLRFIARLNTNTKIMNISIPQILCNYVQKCVTNEQNIMRRSTHRKQTSWLFTKRENKWEDLNKSLKILKSSSE